MTATPIPRTLAMSIYGDLDSLLSKNFHPEEKIKTFLMGENKRLRVFKFLKEQIELGKQIFIVYPSLKNLKKWITKT